MNSPLVSISGPTKVGKDSVIDGVLGKLELPRGSVRHISGGQILRDVAQKRGVTVLEMAKLALQDPEVDRALDAELREQAGRARITHQLVIVNSRLGWWNFPDDFAIGLLARPQVRARRYMLSKQRTITFSQALQEVVERDAADASRYRSLYRIKDFTDPLNFEFPLNTEKLSLDEVVNEVHAEVLELLNGS